MGIQWSFVKRIPKILQMKKVLYISAIWQPVLERTMRNIHSLCDVLVQIKLLTLLPSQSEVCLFQISWHVFWKSELLNQSEFCKSLTILYTYSHKWIAFWSTVCCQNHSDYTSVQEQICCAVFCCCSMAAPQKKKKTPHTNNIGN